MRKIDLTGRKFGRLTVIKQNGYFAKEIAWDCICDCGKECNISGNQMRIGRTKSCGCLRSEISKKNATRHGYAGRIGGVSKTYNVWGGMLNRCKNPNHTSWEHYGGIGIKVCERWSKFENFLEDMGEKPEGLSLDRIDPFGDYEPKNCRWATSKEQRKNQRPRAPLVCPNCNHIFIPPVNKRTVLARRAKAALEKDEGDD